MFVLTADSDNNLESETTFDILTCGTCQKSFALAEIVKFIQHKITQCNKENYGQCYNQSKTTLMKLQFSILNFNFQQQQQMIVNLTMRCLHPTQDDFQYQHQYHVNLLVHKQTHQF